MEEKDGDEDGDNRYLHQSARPVVAAGVVDPAALPPKENVVERMQMVSNVQALIISIKDHPLCRRSSKIPKETHVLRILLAFVVQFSFTKSYAVYIGFCMILNNVEVLEMHGHQKP